jgi:hypothetical protein
VDYLTTDKVLLILLCVNVFLLSWWVKISVNRKIMRNVGIIVLFIGVGLITNYPLAAVLKSGVYEIGDSLNGIWQLVWNSRNLLNLSDTNLMYPLKNTGAMTGSMFAPALFGLPLVLLIANNTLLAYNILVTILFGFTSWGMFVLAKRYVKNYPVALLAGAFISCSLFRISKLNFSLSFDLTLVALAILFFLKYLENRKKRYLVYFIIAFDLQAAGYGYTTAILMISILVLYIYNLISKPLAKSWENTKLLLLMSPLIILPLIPFYLPFIKLYLSGFSRSQAEISEYNTKILDYVNTKSLVYPGKYMEVLLGLSVLVLLVIFFGQLFKYRKAKKPMGSVIADLLNKDGQILYFVILMFLGLFLSFGTRISVGNGYSVRNYVYKLFYYVLPIVKTTRWVPAYTIMFQIGAVIVICYGLDKLIEFIKLRKILIVVSVAVLLFLQIHENIRNRGDLSYFSFPTESEVPDVYKWQKDNDEGPILEVPVDRVRHFRDSYLWAQYQYTYFSTYHNSKLVNGNLSFFPPEYQEMMRVFQYFPNKESVWLMRALGVNRVIVHKSLLSPLEQARIGENLEGLSLVKHFATTGEYTFFDRNFNLVTKEDDDYVFELADSNLKTGISNGIADIEIYGPSYAKPGTKITIPGEIINPSDQPILLKPEDGLFFDYKLSCGDEILGSNQNQAVRKSWFIVPPKTNELINLDVSMPNKVCDWKIEADIKQENGNTLGEKTLIIKPDLGDFKNSINPGELKGTIELGGLVDNFLPNQMAKINYKIKNNGDTLFLRDTPYEEPQGKGSVRLAISFSDTKGEEVSNSRGILLGDVYPGDLIMGDVNIYMPTKPGDYNLSIYLVDELIQRIGDPKEAFNKKIKILDDLTVLEYE